MLRTVDTTSTLARGCVSTIFMVLEHVIAKIEAKLCLPSIVIELYICLEAVFIRQTVDQFLINVRVLICIAHSDSQR